MNKKTILTVAAITVLGAGTLAASSAFAQSVTATQDPTSSLVQKIADKFGLNKSDVQAVFDQNKQDRQANMQANFEKKLSQDVADKKITDAQKTLILNKVKELESNRQATMNAKKDLTPQERKTQMETQRKDLEAWAKQNNIDLKYLMSHGMGHEFGMGGKRGFGKKAPQSTSTPTPTQ